MVTHNNSKGNKDFGSQSLPEKTGNEESVLTSALASLQGNKVQPLPLFWSGCGYPVSQASMNVS